MKDLEQPKKLHGYYVFLCALILVGLTAFGTIFYKEYGISVFVLVPFVIGMLTAFLSGVKKEVKFSSITGRVWLTWLVSNLIFLTFGLEGLICVAMAAPLTIPSIFFGALVGHSLQTRPNINTSAISIFLIVITPFLIGAESVTIKPVDQSVTTEIIIDAPLDVVWDNVVDFPKLEEPEELIFKLGIAYPTHATIEEVDGQFIRECHFSTGPFVEPITEWDKPNKLAFDVTEQPSPMKSYRVSDWLKPSTDAYLKSKRGQFILEKVGYGKTKLIGTTWYEQKLYPSIYWSYLTDDIIHRIHLRVLKHIKKNSETSKL